MIKLGRNIKPNGSSDRDKTSEGDLKSLGNSRNGKHIKIKILVAIIVYLAFLLFCVLKFTLKILIPVGIQLIVSICGLIDLDKESEQFKSLSKAVFIPFVSYFVYKYLKIHSYNFIFLNRFGSKLLSYHELYSPIVKFRNIF